MLAAIESVRNLVEPLGWTVHVAGGFAVAFFASSVFSPSGRHAAVVGRAAAVVVLLTVLGATWLVHPAAGMLLGYFGSHAFGHWRRAKGGLLVALVAAVAFTALGAGWLTYPLVVMTLIWLATGAWGREESKGQKAPAAAAPLPAQASGTPMPAAAAATSALDGPLGSLLRDERLPADARAQLAALNLRTHEALTLLKTQGQEGSEAAYLTRAIREEYAPGAVDAYLKLPRSLADSAPIQDGKSGRVLLAEQLELLLEGVQDVMNTALQAGSQELLTHGRFLRDRFARIESDLRVPVEVKAK